MLTAHLNALVDVHRIGLTGIQTLHKRALVKDIAHQLTSNAPLLTETLLDEKVIFCFPLLISISSLSITIVMPESFSIVMLPSSSSMVMVALSVLSNLMLGPVASSGTAVSESQKQPVQIG